MADITLSASEQFEDKEKEHIVCDVCNKTFLNFGKLKKHIRYHTKPFACDICPNTFPSKNRLNRHLRLHAGLKPYKCPVCQKSFTCKFDVKKHITVHSTEKPFKCEKCEKKFRQKQYFTSHKCINDISNLFANNSTHSSSTEVPRPHKCPTCQKGFVMKPAMIRHFKMHSAENVTCHVCEKKFKHKLYFNRHKCSGKKEDSQTTEVSGKKTFTCDKCGKTLLKKSYKSHMYFHTGDAPFQCEICLKRYTKAGALREHVVIHSGEKNFFCNVCYKTFYRRKDLVAHFQTVKHGQNTV